MPLSNLLDESAVDLAPVAVFAFRRPDHLRRTLDALSANTDARSTHVMVFCDGPRTESDGTAVEQVRKEARRPRAFRRLEVIERDRNNGLAASITSGVTAMLAEHESVIVLEDDIITSPGFLRFMNDGLQRFAADDRVISIHGYSYPTASLENPFFLRGADCWGWATWRRGWALYEPDGATLLNRLRAEGLVDQFDFNSSYPFTGMLEDQIAGRNDSWAVRWYASAFLAGRLTLYPGRTLVRNIGLDGTGTHGGQTERFAGQLAQTAPDLSGIEVVESDFARAAFESFFRGQKPARPHRNMALLPRGRRFVAAAVRRLRRQGP